MTVDFGALLYQSLPGLYRDKDVDGELRRFLEVTALPLAELEASIGQLHQDLFVATCQQLLIPLIGGLVGAEVDTGQPTRAQRAEVQEAVGFYRSKGVREPVLAFAERLTGWRVELVDFSERLAQVPLVDTMDPVALRRDQPVAEQPAGSGRFFFRLDGAPRPLFDARTGRPITREALAADPGAYAGVEGRFTLTERGRDLFRGDTPYQAVAADLTDPGSPRTPAGGPLAVQPGQVAVDPALGRFRIESPLPLATNLRATFSELAPGSIRAQSFPVGDPAVMARLGRSDDPAPATVDLRAPRRPTDRAGRDHLDNLGFFSTPARVAADRRPNLLPPGGQTGHFSFDDHPLAPGDAAGVTLQLLDGLDGTPLTRRRLAAEVPALCGTPRGFSIRVRAMDVLDPGFQPSVRVLAADLTDLAQPRDVNGVPLTLDPGDLAVDPQLGRFRVHPPGLLAAEEVRVDYLLALATRAEDAPAGGLSAAVPEALAFAADGGLVRLVDGRDGTPISTAVRLGQPVGRFHGTRRGWVVRRDGVPVEADLAPLLGDLGRLDAPVPAGRLLVDPDRGRLKFPAGFLTPGDTVTVSYSFEDPAELSQRFDSLAQRLPRAVPAGVVPVLFDTRRPPVDPARLT
jgi:hypothetical protein